MAGQLHQWTAGPSSVSSTGSDPGARRRNRTSVQRFYFAVHGYTSQHLQPKKPGDYSRQQKRSGPASSLPLGVCEECTTLLPLRRQLRGRDMRPPSLCPPHMAHIIPAAPLGSLDDPPPLPQRVTIHNPFRVSFAEPPVIMHIDLASAPGSPMPSDDPSPSPQRTFDREDSPITSPTTDYHIFAVHQRNAAVSFIPDSGATHILIRESDADILHFTSTFAPHPRRPQFEVANR
jgi:hypothetical protein